MRTLGNILWHFPLFGFIDALLTYVIGLLLTLTVVAAPLGLGLMELGKFYIAPFTRRMVSDSVIDPNGKIGLWKAYSWVVMILWLPIGLILALGMVVQVFFLCLSIIGIPVAIVVAKSIGTVLNPVGKRCVSIAVSEEIQRRAAIRQLDGNRAAAVRAEPALQAGAGEGQADRKLELQGEERDRSPSGGARLTRGLKIGLALAVLLLIGVVVGPRVGGMFRAAPPATPTVGDQASKPAKVDVAVAPPPAKPAVLASHTGSPEVIDTATLMVGGERVALAGLRAVDMAEAKAAARAYLAQSGTVKCDSAPIEGWRCTVLAKGLDLAEVFALSGFAKAAANAPEFIRNAESMARENRRGVWAAP